MSERRYSPLATLFAATFLFRIGAAALACFAFHSFRTGLIVV